MWALVALGCVAGLWSAGRRWQVEARNQRVEITLDYNELRAMAVAGGARLPDVLRRFHSAGATSVAIQEETIGALVDAGRVQLVGAGRDGTVLRPEPGLEAPILDAVHNKTKIPVGATGNEPGAPLFLGQPYAFVRSLGVGLDPRTVAEARAAGLGVVGRVQNWDGVTPAGITWTLGALKKQGVGTVIFLGDEVIGYKGFVAGDPEEPAQASAESALRQLGLFFGTVEFVKQKGDALLERAAADRTVRVHTISGAEMVTADIPSNVQRFLLAARERNIRLLFVRLFLQEPDAIETNAGYVEKIARGLERGRLEIGPAHGYAALTAPLPLRLLMTLGLAAAWCLLMDSITGFLTSGGVPRWLVLLIWAGAALLAALCVLPKLAALAAACVFPSLGMIATDLLRPPSSAPPALTPLPPLPSLGEGVPSPRGGGEGVGARPALGVALRRLLFASGITLIGAATLVGLLADRLFLIKADAFVGIKVAQLVPILLAVLVYGLGLWVSEERPWPRVVDETRRDLLALADQPVRVWQVAVGLLALVALALLVLRSGNDPGVGVSPIELRIRGLLDRLLYARPRFKEFLIGHPAMIVALGLAATGRRRWALPLFFVGAIGQVSLLNTFCHLHTPLLVGLWRALLGLGIGVIIGSVALVLVDRWAARALPVSQAAARGG